MASSSTPVRPLILPDRRAMWSAVTFAAPPVDLIVATVSAWTLRDSSQAWVARLASQKMRPPAVAAALPAAISPVRSRPVALLKRRLACSAFETSLVTPRTGAGCRRRRRGRKPCSRGVGTEERLHQPLRITPSATRTARVAASAAICAAASWPSRSSSARRTATASASRCSARSVDRAKSISSPPRRAIASTARQRAIPPQERPRPPARCRVPNVPAARRGAGWRHRSGG